MGTVIFLAVGVVFIVGVVASRRRGSRYPMSVYDEDSTATYAERCFVRSKTRLDASWVSWNHVLGGGPTLAVGNDSFEVRAPKGDLFESRHRVISSTDAEMWHDQIGWTGTFINKKECIHVKARDQRGHRIEFALTPARGLKPAWDALRASGVRTRDNA